MLTLPPPLEDYLEITVYDDDNNIVEYGRSKIELLPDEINEEVDRLLGCGMIHEAISLIHDAWGIKKC